MKGKREIFLVVTVVCGACVMGFILLPLVNMFTSSSWQNLKVTVQDKEVLKSIWLSVYTAGLAAIISFLGGTPFAYLLARKNFFGKKFIESVIDLPMVIPHPVVGIAILSIVGRDYWFGQILSRIGIRIMGSVLGIVVVLTFVGIPFYINTAKDGFKAISEFGAVVIVAYHPMVASVMIYERFEAYGLAYSRPIAVLLTLVCLLLFLVLRVLSVSKLR